MISSDLINAYNGVQITIGKKPQRENPVNTKKFFIQKTKGGKDK